MEVAVQMGQAVQTALGTWSGTARLCAVLLCMAVAGAVFLQVWKRFRR